MLDREGKKSWYVIEEIVGVIFWGVKEELRY